MLSKISPKKKWSKSGVSEVLGNILLLAITVVLFSSVIVMVWRMPMPTEVAVADFKAELNFNTSTTAYLNITHIGGEPLYEYFTDILIDTGVTDSKLYNLTDDPRFSSDAPWKIGETWSAYLEGITTSAKVLVSIRDIEAHSVIWHGTVSGGLGTNAPKILQRWVDSDITTATPDPIRESGGTTAKSWYFFVRVIDPEDDLDEESVWLDTSLLPNGNSHVTGIENDRVWRFSFSNISDASQYDGKPIFIHAQDQAGHEIIEVYQLTVLQPDITIHEGPEYELGSQELAEGGMPYWIIYQGAGHGYVILGENKTHDPPDNPRIWGALADVDDPKSTFVQGEEWIFVRVGSTTLANVLGKNTMTVVNRLSGEIVSPPSSSNAFTRLTYTGNAYIYESKFNSSILAPGAYDVIMDLKSSLSEGGTVDQLYIIGNLTILPQTGQKGIFVPEIKIYKDSNRNPSDEWGTSSNPFDLSNANISVVWVELNMNTSAAPTTLRIEEVRIKDFRGRSNLFGSPPTENNMLSANQSDSSTKYWFSIDLRLKNGVSWLGGLAAYSLTISNIFDDDEGVYTISMSLWVRSPVSIMNYIAGTTGLGIGHQNFAHFEYLFQIDQNKFFTTRALEERDESPGAGYTASLNLYDLLYFDMDEDGDRDVLAAIFDVGKDTHVLGIYINRLDEYGIWEKRTNFDEYTEGYGILSMAYGDVDLDGDLDWVVACESTVNNKGGYVYLFKNDYPINKTALFVPDDDVGFVEMRLTDVTGDGKADLIALDCGDNVEYDETTINRGTADARMRVFNLSATSGLYYELPDTDVPSIGFIYDFEMADMDNDNDYDMVLVTGSDGIRWYNRTQDTASPAQATADNTIIGSTTGTYVRTHTNDNVDYQIIQEDGGNLDHTWNVSTVGGTKPVAYIDIKVSPSADEGFYFYYSTASTGGPWIFMFAIPSNVDTDYTYSFPLPLGTSGEIYFRVIDALDSSSSGEISDTSIYVDMIQVIGVTDVSFTDEPYVELSSDSSYIAIGVGNFDGLGKPDVAVAKNGMIEVIDDGGNTLYTVSDVDLSPNGDTFCVRDVNGDRRADIISIKEDLNDDIIIIYEWLNLGDGTTYQGIKVKDLGMFVAGTSGLDFSGDIMHLSVEDPYG